MRNVREFWEHGGVSEVEKCFSHTYERVTMKKMKFPLPLISWRWPFYLFPWHLPWLFNLFTFEKWLAAPLSEMKRKKATFFILWHLRWLYRSLMRHQDTICFFFMGTVRLLLFKTLKSLHTFELSHGIMTLSKPDKISLKL